MSGSLVAWKTVPAVSETWCRQARHWILGRVLSRVPWQPPQSGQMKMGEVEGSEFEVKADLVLFAGISGDTNPVHTDEVYARITYEAGPPPSVAAAPVGVTHFPPIVLAIAFEAIAVATASFVTSLGFDVIGLVPSPIEGGDGKREVLLGARIG